MATQPTFAVIDTLQTHVPDEEQSTKDKIYSVAEFVDYINGMLQPLEFIVQGEISRVDERGSAVYFTLCDTEEKAVLNCMVWRNKLSSYGITLREGLEVKVSGTANIYKPIGKFSFMAEYITPVGDGALKQAFEQLKKKLQEQGFFDTERKRIIPSYVNTIGLITSDSADAKKDFITHLGNHGIKIKFFDVRVEGIKAVTTIIDAIRWFNENTQDVEVLVLTRGGGSMESLQAFNSEEVAKAIFSSRIPVISAVGHENDVTIADLVADYRASTPTHAGKYLGENWNKAEQRVEEIEQSIYSIFRLSCNKLRDKVEVYQQNFLSSYRQSLESTREGLNNFDRSFSSSFQDIFRRFRHITEKYTYCFNQYLNKYSEAKNQLRTLELYFYDFKARWYGSVVKYFLDYERALLASDPQLKLKQGYSITRDKEGKIIRSTNNLVKDDTIQVQLHSGQLKAHIENIT